MQDGRLDIINN